MTPELKEALDLLSPTQRRAVEWDDGAALVLAGPGAGKTLVLTTRVARILDSSPNRNFRVLALTFTTKAADEMRTRVQAMIPDLADRTVIGTFHSFCAQLLRQHGSHLSIRPDFGIYDQDEDRAELLRDALADAADRGEPVTSDDTRWLNVIDQLRSSLVSPEKTARHFRDAAAGQRAARVYTIYEEALRQNNVMDFNGMILDTCRLVHKMPSVASRIRQSYPHWLIDEFQDTTPAQYRLIRFLADDKFSNIFVVADDDQIIYQWAGASYQQISAFRQKFSPELIQLVENRRCPPEIVQAANNLIANNSERTPDKAPLVATLPNTGPAIFLRTFATDFEESEGVAKEIAKQGEQYWRKTVVLGRTRAILQPLQAALKDLGVNAFISTRRGRFVSPQFLWLHSCLDLSLRPTDRRMLTTMTSAANRIAGIELDAAMLTAEAQSLNASYLETWALSVKKWDNEIAAQLADFGLRLVNARTSWRRIVKEAIDWLSQTVEVTDVLVNDVAEDRAAWEAAAREIRAEKGGQPDLYELLQGIALRPKEPPPDPTAIRLMTIHAAKGLEFDNVWVIGIAEEIIPSWQSLKSGASPAELQEERRNFFVAITRTQRQLLLSYANQYRGWRKQPSRFLKEMEL